MEKKITVSDNSNRTHFPDPLMSLNNVVQTDPWPKNTILITEDSMINRINEKSFSTNLRSVEVRFFSETTMDGEHFNLTSLLSK